MFISRCSLIHVGSSSSSHVEWTYADGVLRMRNGKMIKMSVCKPKAFIFPILLKLYNYTEEQQHFTQLQESNHGIIEANNNNKDGHKQAWKAQLCKKALKINKEERIQQKIGGRTSSTVHNTTKASQMLLDWTGLNSAAQLSRLPYIQGHLMPSHFCYWSVESRSLRQTQSRN